MCKTNSERAISIANPYDGTDIPAVLNEPGRDLGEIYLLLHGLTTGKGEYLDFYVRVAQRLATHGIGSIRFDFRGHGDSQAPADEFTILNSASDVLSCSLWLQKEHPGVRQSIFATSFGAGPGIVAAAARSSWFHKLRLLAPILNLNELYLNPIHPARRSYMDFPETTLAGAGRHTIDDRRTFGYMNALEFVTIDLVGLVNHSHVPPVVVMHGTADTIVPYDSTVRGLTGSKVRLVTFEGMDHGFMDIDDPDGHGPRSQGNLDRIISELIGP